ncbi:hypothetical protein TorRG33x02_208240 [Trema orientale]|uniref:Uncharacterized protein n=1 Tax=Trema orientale TaxID=63057 RepID=A0A2P5ECY6_TREOI|nr:hypothetical protein TorRG33x02_208240 [Trema orientale]
MPKAAKQASRLQSPFTTRHGAGGRTRGQPDISFCAKKRCRFIVVMLSPDEFQSCWLALNVHPGCPSQSLTVPHVAPKKSVPPNSVHPEPRHVNLHLPVTSPRSLAEILPALPV